MSTSVHAFNENEIKVRWREPYVSSALNQQNLGTLPAGIHRGFLVTPDSEGLRVRIEPAQGDEESVAIALSRDTSASLWHGVVIRRETPFTVDLSPFQNQTIVLAIAADYRINSPTTAFVRAYSRGEWLTLNPLQRRSLVPLAQVVVPETGPIPSGAISYGPRREAWTDALASQAAPWIPYFQNPGFELGGEEDAVWWEADATSHVEWEVTEDQTHSGRRSMVLREETNAGEGTFQASMGQELVLFVHPGQRLRFEAWCLVPAGVGFISAEAVFRYSMDGAPDHAQTVPFHRSIPGGTWTKLETFAEVPAGVGVLTSVEFRCSGDLSGTERSLLYLDDVQFWVQPIAGVVNDALRTVIGTEYTLVSLDKGAASLEVDILREGDQDDDAFLAIDVEGDEKIAFLTDGVALRSLQNEEEKILLVHDQEGLLPGGEIVPTLQDRAGFAGAGFHARPQDQPAMTDPVPHPLLTAGKILAGWALVEVDGSGATILEGVNIATADLNGADLLELSFAAPPEGPIGVIADTDLAALSVARGKWNAGSERIEVRIIGEQGPESIDPQTFTILAFAASR